jgi:hypothetical protein
MKTTLKMAIPVVLISLILVSTALIATSKVSVEQTSPGFGLSPVETGQSYISIPALAKPGAGGIMYLSNGTQVDALVTISCVPTTSTSPLQGFYIYFTGPTGLDLTGWVSCTPAVGYATAATYFVENINRISYSSYFRASTAGTYEIIWQIEIMPYTPPS